MLIPDKEAPSWNKITKAFAGNTDVSFADVNLSQESIRGPPNNPGTGGWPTIRYFNKDTGLDGGNYAKKTDGAMCDELGNEEMMTAYVEDYGKTSLCSASDLSGCSEKEMAYIKKMKSKSQSDQNAQLTRLMKMEGETMTADLSEWLMKRKKILKQLVQVDQEL